MDQNKPLITQTVEADALRNANTSCSTVMFMPFNSVSNAVFHILLHG